MADEANPGSGLRRAIVDFLDKFEEDQRALEQADGGTAEVGGMKVTDDSPSAPWPTTPPPSDVGPPVPTAEPGPSPSERELRSSTDDPPDPP